MVFGWLIFENYLRTGCIRGQWLLREALGEMRTVYFRKVGIKYILPPNDFFS